MFINVQLKRFRDTPKLEEDQDYQRHLNVVRSKTQPLLFSLDSFPLTEIFFNEDKFISTVLIALAVSTHVPLFTEIGELVYTRKRLVREKIAPFKIIGQYQLRLDRYVSSAGRS